MPKSSQLTGRSLKNVPFRLLVVTTLLVSAAWAENNNEPQQVTGKILAIERKGAMAKLTIDRYDGGQMDLIWSTKGNFQVHAKGDDKFFRPNVWVTTSARKQGNAWYAEGFQVHVKSKLAPGIAKDPRGTGSEFDVCGMLVGYDKNAVTISVGQAPPLRILLDNNALDRIKVSMSTSDFAEVGSEVDMEGIVKGKKFIPSKVVVKLEKTISADQAFSKKRIDHKADAAGKGVAAKTNDGDAKPAEAKGKEVKGKVAPRGKKGAVDMANPDPFNALGDKPAPKGKKKN